MASPGLSPELFAAMPQESLSLSLPYDCIWPIIVTINPLRFSFRSAGGASENYESYGQSGSG